MLITSIGKEHVRERVMALSQATTLTVSLRRLWSLGPINSEMTDPTCGNSFLYSKKKKLLFEIVYPVLISKLLVTAMIPKPADRGQTKLLYPNYHAYTVPTL